MKEETTLKKNHEFRRVYRRGASAVGGCMVVYCRRNGLGRSRLGLTASTKIGSAVQRNRARRRLREVWRLGQDALRPGYDVILVARGRALTASWDEMRSTFLRLCRKLGMAREDRGSGPRDRDRDAGPGKRRVPSGTDRPTGTAPSAGTNRPAGAAPSAGTARPTGTAPSAGTDRPAGTGPSAGTVRPTGTAPSAGTDRPAGIAPSTGTDRPAGAARPVGTAPSAGTARPRGTALSAGTDRPAGTAPSVGTDRPVGTVPSAGTARPGETGAEKEDPSWNVS